MTVSGGNPPQRPDQRLQPRSRAGSGPAPQQNVFTHLIIVPGGTITIGAGGTIIIGSGGSIEGTNWILNQQGYFQYSAPLPPAPGTLIQSSAPIAGTDSAGNPYPGTTGISQNFTANGQTFNSNLSNFVRATYAASFTGMIMAPGDYPNQQCQIYGTSGTNTLTMAAEPISNVAGGTANIIGPSSGAGFAWDAPDARWMPL